MVERKFILSFSRELVNAPITFRLVRDHRLDVNILRAEINEQGGRLILSMSGDRAEIGKAVAYLEKENVQVNELDRYVIRDESRCTDCSICTSICPVKAYRLDRETWKVYFDHEKCIACGLCVDACPAGALSKNRVVTESI